MNNAHVDKPPLHFNTLSILSASYGEWTAELSDHERDLLSRIGRITYFSKGDLLYEAGTPYEFLFVIVQGVVKTFHESHDGRCTVIAFLFDKDLAGLGEEGAYANSAAAVDSVVAYRLPVYDLERLLKSESHLEMLLLCKACNELRASQQHAILLSRHSAKIRVALFLALIAARQAEGETRIRLPMGRAEIGSYLGLSMEAVSRSFGALEASGILLMAGPRQIEIVNRPAFAALVADFA